MALPHPTYKETAVPVKDISGMKFGMVTVIDRADFLIGSAQHAAWRCVCDCGNEFITSGASIRAGRTRSCGCKSAEKWFTNTTGLIHGKSRCRAYKIWAGMHARCRRPTKKSHLYFGKGIRVCERWNNFANFMEDMGDPPDGTSIDRIDGNGHYSPENCRWATKKEQANNMRTNRVLEHGGLSMSVAGWAEKLGVKQNTLLYRIRRGWSVEEALTITVHPRRKAIRA